MGDDKGGDKEGDTGGEKGVPGTRMRPGNPPPRKKGSLRVATRERGFGGRGANRANRANRSNPPPSRRLPSDLPSDLWGGWGANRANRGVGGEPGTP